MNSIILGLTMLAIAGLVIWTGKDHSLPSKTWWPFAIREVAPQKTSRFGLARERVQPRAAPSRSDQRPWRRSGS
jgi:hypothetical protein